MNEINYSEIETGLGWKKFRITLFITLFLFVLYEFDFTEFASLIIFLLFWISIIVAFYYLVDSLIVSKNHNLYPKFSSISIAIILITSMPLIHCYRNGLFWGNPILVAEFIDDRSRMDLEFYRNRKYILVDSWMFGSKQYLGDYLFKGDTIQLNKFPLKNDSVGNIKLLRNSSSIYFELDSTGKYDTTFYKFKITQTQE